MRKTNKILSIECKISVYSCFTLVSHGLMFFRCRHSCIAEFFGDEKPECDKACDICKEPKKAERNLLDLQKGRFASVNQGPRGGGTMYYVEEDGSGDMYGGGRKGAKK